MSADAALVRRRVVLALELAIFLFAVLLRVPALWTTANEANYDLVDHLRYVDWFKDHFEAPPLDHSRVTYGPPLYYFLCGLLRRLGASHGDLAIVSFVLGLGRLGLLWWGLRQFVVSGVARVGALALAAVLPAAVHIDGMINNESLNIFLCTAALLLAYRAHQAEGAARTRQALFAGLFCGLALWTKFSALMLLIAMLLAAVVEASWRGGGAKERLRRMAPWLAAVGLAAAIAAPWYVRNVALHGRAFPTAFHTHDGWAVPKELRDVPLWQKRPVVYYFGFNASTLQYPFFPNDHQGGQARFLSNLLATTFADYYNFQFARPPGSGDKAHDRNHRLRERTVTLGRASIAAGLWLVVMTMGAALWLFVWAIRRRRAGEVMLLFSAGLAIGGQAYFATQFPADMYGVVKATYLQFAAAPLFAAFGLGVAWAARRWLSAPLSVVSVAALLTVALYTTHERLTWY